MDATSVFRGMMLLAGNFHIRENLKPHSDVFLTFYLVTHKLMTFNNETDVSKQLANFWVKGQLTLDLFEREREKK